MINVKKYVEWEKIVIRNENIKVIDTSLNVFFIDIL